MQWRDQVFYIKQHNTLDPLRVHLLDENRQPIVGDVFLGATARFRMRASIGNVAVLDAPAQLIQNPDSSWDAEYDWQIGDTAVVGVFRGEFPVTRADGKEKTYPDPETIMIVITAAVGG